jgi:polygalacturonase
MQALISMSNHHSILPLVLVLAASTLSAPTWAEQVYNVREMGAVGDGQTLDTAAIQKSFDACRKSGGGTVVIPAGTYLSAPLVIRTKTTLRLEQGATLKATDEPSAYARPDEPAKFNNFLTGKDLEDVTIEGPGTIDGSGERWWIPAEEARQKKSGYTLPRPNLIVLTRVTNLVVRNITIQNSPKFHFVPTECDGVRVENATFLAPERAPNTDAIDPSMCRNVTITGSTIDVGDDNVAVKSGKTIDGREFAADGLTITNCTIKHGHGISIGSETVGGVANVVVRDCTFEDTDYGLRIKSDRTRGGTVENLLYENIQMKNVRGAITFTSYYPKIPATDSPQPVTKTTPAYRNITVRNLTATSTKYAGVIVGLPESPIENVRLENVHIVAQGAGLEIRHVRGIDLVDTTIEAKKGPPLVVSDADVDENAATSKDNN